MRFKKGFLIICLIVCLISIAGVSAGDANDTGVLPDGTFTDLANDIANADGEFNLTRNYNYAEDDSSYGYGIEIDKSIVINGNGYTINGNNQACVFDINASDVTLNNINFVNAHVTIEEDPDYDEEEEYYDQSIFKGGAISWTGDNGVLTNCSFANSFAAYGGSVYWSGSNGILSHCSFVNSSAKASGYYGCGGAVMWTGDNGRLFNCSFVKSYSSMGGSVYWRAAYGVLANCSFVDSLAAAKEWSGEGGAIQWFGLNGVLANCSFIDCTSNFRAGAVFWGSTNGILSGCSFINCEADSLGGGIYFSATNCTLANSFFEGNRASLGSDWNSENPFNAFNITPTFKVSTVLSASDVTVNAGRMGSLRVTLKDENNNSVSGQDVTILLDNVYHYFTAYHGAVNFVIPDSLRRNTYVANISFAGNVGNTPLISDAGYIEYSPSSTNANVIVNKLGMLIDCPNVSVEYNDGSQLVAKVRDMDTLKIIRYYGDIIVNIDGVNHALRTNSKGQVKLPFNKLVPGIYTATISFLGDRYYGSSSKTASVIVNKANINIFCEDTSVISNDNGVITAKLTHKTTGKLIRNAKVWLDINGKKYSVMSDSKGMAVFSTNGINPGNYTAPIYYSGGAKFNPANTSINIVVNRADINISCDGDVCIFCRDDSEIVATFTHAVTGKSVTNAKAWLEVNGKKYSVMTDSKGMAVFSTNGIASGNYTAIIYYAGGARYNPSNTSFNLVANKATTIVSASFNGTNIIANITHGITGKAIANAKITVKINGTKYTLKSDSNGIAVLSLEGIAGENCTATVSYAGNAKYFSSKMMIKNSETKDTSSISTAYDMENRQITATLIRSAAGSPIKGETIVIKVGDEKYSLKADSNGQVRISTEGWASKIYTVNTSYAGTGKITSTNNAITILVDD